MYKYLDLTVTLLLRTQTPVAPIWRRFLVPTSASFLDLHKAIQVASGSWQDYHLYQFQEKRGWGADAKVFACAAGAEYEDLEVPPPHSGQVKLS